MHIEPSVSLEEKLFYNRNHIDLGRSHTGVRAHNAVTAAAYARESRPRASLRAEGQVRRGDHPQRLHRMRYPPRRWRALWRHEVELSVPRLWCAVLT